MTGPLLPKSARNWHHNGECADGDRIEFVEMSRATEQKLCELLQLPLWSVLDSARRGEVLRIRGVPSCRLRKATCDTVKRIYEFARSAGKGTYIALHSRPGRGTCAKVDHRKFGRSE